MTDDRQTDYATEKCVAITGIAGARAVPPNAQRTLRKLETNENKLNIKKR